MSTIKSLLDQRYGLRTPRLHATVTAAPLVAGRSAGYVIATVGGVGGRACQRVARYARAVCGRGYAGC